METTPPEPVKPPLEKPVNNTVATNPQTVVTPVQQAPVQKKGNGLKIACIVLIVLLLLCIIVSAIGYKIVTDNAAKWGQDLGNKVSDEIGKEINNKVNDSIQSAGSDLFNSGTEATLPVGFPTDIPLIPGYRLTTATKDTVSSGESYYALLTIDQTVDQVKSYYESALTQNGWTFEESTFLFITSYTATKNGNELNVTITGSTDNSSPNTLISLTHMKS